MKLPIFAVILPLFAAGCSGGHAELPVPLNTCVRTESRAYGMGITRCVFGNHVCYVIYDKGISCVVDDTDHGDRPNHNGDDR